jgi:hypothetical protein
VTIWPSRFGFFTLPNFGLKDCMGRIVANECLDA